MEATPTAQEALAWVNNSAGIRQFLRAPYHGHLKTKGPNTFVYDTQKLRGLTDPLRECFWQQEASAVARKRFYASDPAKKTGTTTKRPAPPPVPKRANDFFHPAHPPPLVLAMKPARAPAKGKAPKTNAIKTGGGKKGKKKNALKQASIAALRQGSQVHRQIDQVVKLGVSEFLARNVSFHPYALAVILALHAFDPELRILHSEYLAGCPTLGIATRIDIVCVDRAGRIYVVETKTGSPTAHSWTGCNGLMGGALKDYFGNSAHNRAKVQAIAGAMLAILGTQLSLGQVRCLVAHVNAEHVTLELVPDDVVATVGPIIYAALLTRRKHRLNLKNMKREHGAQQREDVC